TQSPAISFSDLQPSQQIKVEWSYRACFSSTSYDLVFRAEPHLQIEAMSLAGIADYKDKYHTIQIAKSELNEWDKMLAEYRGAEKGKCGLSEETVTVSLYDYSGETSL